MKTLLLAALTTVLAQTASATSILIPRPDTRVINYKVLEGSKFAKEHLAGLQYGTAQINYSANTVSLNVVEKKNCAKGMMCTMNIRALSVELPIVNRTHGDCNIVTITAQKDERPVDGIFQQITIEDYSNVESSDCRFFAPYVGKSTYTTSFVNRTNGKTVTAKSDIRVQIQHPDDTPVEAVEFFSLTDSKLISGFGSQQIVSGSLQLNSETATLDIVTITPCPKGAFCLLASIPQHTTLELKVVSSQPDENGCGSQIIKAEAADTQGDAKSAMFNTVTIKNHSKNVCDMVTPHLVEVEYQKIDPRMFAPVKEALFFFDQFVVQ